MVTLASDQLYVEVLTQTFVTQSGDKLSNAMISLYMSLCHRAAEMDRQLLLYVNSFLALVDCCRIGNKSNNSLKS
jgi:hypothetical protein